VGHTVLYGTKEGQKPSNAGALGLHRNTFKEFWQENLKKKERLKNPDRRRRIN